MEQIINSLLENDLYKFSMGQVIYHQFSDYKTTWDFKCRNKDVYLSLIHIQNEAIEQIRRMCDYPMTEGAKIRIMPDVHSGKGCTIGTTMTIKDRVVPNVVGVDIGCGMYTVCLGKGEIDFAKVDEAAHRCV